MSQSLLHQVTYSDNMKLWEKVKVRYDVSIPFTSGHVFRRLRPPRSHPGKPDVSIPFTSGHVFRPNEKGTVPATILNVSIPFTSGHVFRLVETHTSLEFMDVSIPFTSGHVFRLPNGRRTSPRSWMSQSLLHQVTYSDFTKGNGSFDQAMSQSLLHQVTYSDTSWHWEWLATACTVSIPFTSGHVFRPRRKSGLRSPKSSVSIPFTSGHVFRPRRKSGLRSPKSSVSIPFTSGHVFRHSVSMVSMQQEKCLNPFYIRSRIPTKIMKQAIITILVSQSLLHQVTYSDKENAKRRGSESEIVSIPFTSGHVFRHLNLEPL